MTQPGYAIEHDCSPPEQLDRTLRPEPLAGMCFAGPINGTTGYEEAAAQGIVAGIDAARDGEMESLSRESREKVAPVRGAETPGQARRIPGVSPADLQSLAVEVEKRGLAPAGVSRETRPGGHVPVREGVGGRFT